MKIYHTDVFSNTPLAGNGLTVIFPEQVLETRQMQQIACEFKQFETIFLWKIEETKFKARIFTVEEELDFAGHPVLGAAAVVHQKYFKEKEKEQITFQLPQKEVVTESLKKDGCFEVVMNQGKAEWGCEISSEWRELYCRALNLKQEELSKEYPMEVVSTGLPYLLVPIEKGIEHVKIQCTDLETLLEQNGAKFVYIFDIEHLECRTWDNLGAVEDVATGSAAGPVGAYLFAHRCFDEKEEIQLHQGRFVNRPSILKVTCKPDTREICVAGDVKILLCGELEV